MFDTVRRLTDRFDDWWSCEGAPLVWRFRVALTLVVGLALVNLGVLAWTSAKGGADDTMTVAGIDVAGTVQTNSDATRGAGKSNARIGSGLVTHSSFGQEATDTAESPADTEPPYSPGSTARTSRQPASEPATSAAPSTSSTGSGTGGTGSTGSTGSTATTVATSEPSTTDGEPGTTETTETTTVVDEEPSSTATSAGSTSSTRPGSSGEAPGHNKDR